MWRLVILGIVAVILYFMVKSAWRGLFGKDREAVRSVGSAAPPSEMVQDPICGMYVSKEGAFFVQHAGQTRFFCSETCRASYQKKLSSA